MAHCLTGGCAAGLCTPIREKASTASIFDRRRGEDAPFGNFTCGLVGRGVDTEGIGRGVKGVGPGNFIPALLDCAWWGVDGEGVRCGVDGLGRDNNKVPWDADTGEGDSGSPVVEDKGKLIPK
jgi:hypothetical protein